MQVGRFRGQIDVEDTPFWVVSYDAADGCIELTDRTREPLDPDTLAPDPDGALRCRVKQGRFPARFQHAAQALLLHAVEIEDGEPRIRAGDRRLPARGLADF